MASRDLMMDLWNLVLTISASGVISQTQEKANRSTPPRREHRLELRSSGTMSMRRSVRYTEVERSAASRSMAVPGLKKKKEDAFFDRSAVVRICLFFFPDRLNERSLYIKQIRKKKT